MLKNMTFNGERMDDIYLLKGRSKSPFHSRSRTIKRVGDTTRLTKTEKEPIEIKQPIGFKALEDEAQIDIIERLTDWLITDSWAILSFDDEPGRSYEAVLQNDMSDFEKIATFRKGTLEFIAKSTIGDEKTETIKKGKTKTVSVSGQESTSWTAKVKFDKDADKFELKGEYGRNITLHYSFVEGDVLEIDYAKRKVTLNDNDIATSIDLRTKWFELPTGSVKLEASHDTEITYYERYY